VNNSSPARTGQPTPPTESEYDRLADLVRASQRAQAVYNATPTKANFDAWGDAIHALIDCQDAIARGQQ
jgi:hypothetical protein